MSARLSELEYAELLVKMKKNPPISTVREKREATQKVNAIPSKYKNQKTEIDGIMFASKKEAARYQDLKLLEKSGEIRDLKLQVPFVFEYNGVKICTYFADFTYVEGRRRIVEDVKGGKRTKEYIIKRKLMRAFFLQDVLET